MIGASRRCEVCRHAFLFRTASPILRAAVELYLFLKDYVKHVRSHARIANGLNPAGLYYLGLHQ